MAKSKRKIYDQTKFTPEILREAIRIFRSSAAKETRFRSLLVSTKNETWEFDEDVEMFSRFRSEDVVEGIVSVGNSSDDEFRFTYLFGKSIVKVSLNNVSKIEEVFEALEAGAESCKLPEKAQFEQLSIFIGHGRNPAWRDVRDHLQDKHGLNVKAYESEPRAGLTITDILSELSAEASFAILVLTAEDEDAEGRFRARENVIHEVGLFQGTLGFKRTLLLLEDGCAPFSNIAGLQYVPFAKGNPKETFGEILATIRREINRANAEE